MMMDFLRRLMPAKIEQRAMGRGFTAEVMATRAAYLSGSGGLGQLTATVQACVGLWEGAFSAAAVNGVDILTRRTMAIMARQLALRGEAVFHISADGLVPVFEWELGTRDGAPKVYKVSIPEIGGATVRTVLAAEVLHVRIGSSAASPWAGTAPLRRAALTAGLLHELETALSEVYAFAPLGSQIVPFPEAPETDTEAIGRGFSGRRGRVLLRESTMVTAAGGPAPVQDWRPSDVTPDLRNSMAVETLEAARNAVCGAFGVLPALFAGLTQGPLVREAQRHLATWTLQPIADVVAEEATAKLGQPVDIDVILPLQAYDVGGRARAFSTFIEAISKAKESGLTAQEVTGALNWVTLAENDGRP